MDSQFEDYQKDLKAKKTLNAEDLEKLVLPLIRPATKIIVNKATRAPKDSQLISHFGGQPYFEEGEEWPKTKDNRSLGFIFQVFNNNEINLPENIKLIQFFYDWEECPWDTESEGWIVKIYESINTERKIKIDKPSDLEKSKYCTISFESIKSLPDWDGLESYSEEASNLSCELNLEEPWINYQNVVEKITGEQECQSQIGGYPHWIQGDGTPENKDGESMRFLFQIDSEDNADIMWGDVGLIYVFYDESNKRTEFTLQCC